MRIFNLFTSLIVIGFAAQAVAEEGAAPAGRKFGYSNGPEAQTIPEGVARFRLPYQVVNGNTTYDKDGNKSDSAATVSVTGGSLIAEYGLSSKLSLQMRMDYRQKQEIKITDAFRASTKASTYTTNFSSLGSGITNQETLTTALRSAMISVCTAATGASTETCGTNYESGAFTSAALQKTSSNATIKSLATSFGNGSASVSAKAYVTAAAAASETSITSGVNTALDAQNYSGNAALGDTTVGALYNLAQEDMYWASIGAGIRIPTGNRNLANKYEQDTTRSAYEIGVRLDFDILPTDWFTMSFEDQIEAPIMGTKREVGGVSHEIKRKGIRNVGFVAFKPSLEPLAPALGAVKTQFGVKFDFDNGELDTESGKGTTGGARTQQMWKYVSVGYNFIRDLQIPVQFDVDHEIPHSGKNVTIAVTKTTATLKTFAKF